MDILPARRAKSSTTPVTSSEPAKAASTREAEPRLPTMGARKIKVMPTTIRAPVEMPSTKGPAMGLRKNTWSR